MSSRAPLQAAALTFEKQQVLKNHPLFAKFRPEVLARLCTYVVARKFKREDVIKLLDPAGSGANAPNELLEASLVPMDGSDHRGGNLDRPRPQPQGAVSRRSHRSGTCPSTRRTTRTSTR